MRPRVRSTPATLDAFVCGWTCVYTICNFCMSGGFWRAEYMCKMCCGGDWCAISKRVAPPRKTIKQEWQEQMALFIVCWNANTGYLCFGGLYIYIPPPVSLPPNSGRVWHAATFKRTSVRDLVASSGEVTTTWIPLGSPLNSPAKGHYELWWTLSECNMSRYQTNTRNILTL